MKTLMILFALFSLHDVYAQEGKVRNVAIFVHEGVELLDFAGPGEVFASGGREFNVYTVASSASTLTSQRFLSVKPTYTFADCPKPDILILPGGATQIPAGDEKVIDWIQSVGKNTEYILTVCTGAILLAKAGLLDGKTATTHYCCRENLASEYPKVNVIKDVRWVDNGNIITTEGISAGIDGSLYLISKIKGPDQAKRIANYMMYDWDISKLTYKVVNHPTK